jgi:hypothetical protein
LQSSEAQDSTSRETINSDTNESEAAVATDTSADKPVEATTDEVIVEELN